MVVGKHEKRPLRIVHCGDFCGDLSYILANLATSQITLPQLVNRLNLRGLQGFLPSVQQVSIFDGNGLRNQKSTVEIFTGAVDSPARRGCRPQAGSEAPGYRALRKGTACRALAPCSSGSRTADLLRMRALRIFFVFAQFSR